MIAPLHDISDFIPLSDNCFLKLSLWSDPFQSSPQNYTLHFDLVKSREGGKSNTQRQTLKLLTNDIRS